MKFQWVELRRNGTEDIAIHWKLFSRQRLENAGMSFQRVRRRDAPKMKIVGGNELSGRLRVPIYWNNRSMDIACSVGGQK